MSLKCKIYCSSLRRKSNELGYEHDRSSPMMWFQTRSSRKATEVGAELANRLITAAPNSLTGEPLHSAVPARQLQEFLVHVEREVRPQVGGPWSSARLANSFKWYLLDKGAGRDFADELTRLLVLRLSSKVTSPAVKEKHAAPAVKQKPQSLQFLLSRADAAAARGNDAEAAEYYRQVLDIKPRHPIACNSLGVALHRLGRYAQSETLFRRAVKARPSDPVALRNLGNTLRLRGQVLESELPLRAAVKLKPTDLESQVSLGQTLTMFGRLGQARDCFQRALRLDPHHPGSLCGLAQISASEGRFAEAEGSYRLALQSNPKLPTAWAGLVGMRKMLRSDTDWLQAVEGLVSDGLPPEQECGLRFALGKFYDDVGDFAVAFRNYERANKLQKMAAVPYEARARTRVVDGIIRGYPVESLARPDPGSCDSTRPVFVVGMMRSGTTLLEQIIAAHPAAAGAGELSFWNDAARKHPDASCRSAISVALRQKLAADYLSTLNRRAGDAQRVVDKSTYNVDHLGLIHSVFPNARIICTRRNPVDVGLSCYFTQLSTAHNFAMDLADLTHHFAEHQRLMEHWRRVLPSETLCEVSYAQLVSDPERCARQVISFVGLEWDAHCLASHTLERPVLTASFWQVRQPVYKTSLERWRNYERFLGPLLASEDSG
jgi:Flp pilus assembly protein TadD